MRETLKASWRIIGCPVCRELSESNTNVMVVPETKRPDSGNTNNNSYTSGRANGAGIKAEFHLLLEKFTTGPGTGVVPLGSGHHQQ